MSKNSNFELTDEHISILARCEERWRKGESIGIVSGDEYEMLEALSEEDFEGVENPVVVDAADANRTDVRRVVEACASADEPVIMDRDEAEAWRSLDEGGREVLKACGYPEGTVDAMNPESLSAALESAQDDAVEVLSLSDLDQTPETGGQPPADSDETDVDPERLDALRSKWESAAKMSDRTPKTAATWREEVADALDEDPDDEEAIVDALGLDGRRM